MKKQIIKIVKLYVDIKILLNLNSYEIQIILNLKYISPK